MTLTIVLENQNFEFDVNEVRDISIPLRFNGSQPNIFKVKKAESRAYESGEVIGDTRKGGSCNFDRVILTPHCNGTHTECLGHLSYERVSVQEQLKDSMIPSTLISVKPEAAKDTEDHYDPPFEAGDLVISRKLLQEALASVSGVFLKGLIVRTLPNDHSKLSRDYSVHTPPFFSLEAMSYIASLGIDHLLVDLPSVDRSNDEGKLRVHRLFWNLPDEGHEINSASWMHKTITEMIYVKEEIPNGSYLLNLQIAPFEADASPSRPLIYPLINS